MKVKVWHIDWDVSDEDYEENLGGTEDENGLPYAPKDLGLPAWDSVVELEIFPPDNDPYTIVGEITTAIEKEFGFAFWSFDHSIVES